MRSRDIPPKVLCSVFYKAKDKVNYNISQDFTYHQLMEKVKDSSSTALFLPYSYTLIGHVVGPSEADNISLRGTFRMICMCLNNEI